jgi:hypothetical protein
VASDEKVVDSKGEADGRDLPSFVGAERKRETKRMRGIGIANSVASTPGNSRSLRVRAKEVGTRGGEKRPKVEFSDSQLGTRSSVLELGIGSANVWSSPFSTVAALLLSNVSVSIVGESDVEHRVASRTPRASPSKT